MSEQIHGACAFAEDPAHPATVARLFWHPEVDPRVIVAEAHPSFDRGDTFDVYAQQVPVDVVRRPNAGEELLLNAGLQSVRLSIASGTVMNGPVHLVYRIVDSDALDLRLLALRRFAGLRRNGRIPVSLFPISRRTDRWSLMIDTLNAMAFATSHRAVAVSLFGKSTVDDQSDAPSDFLRARVRRLISGARSLAQGGYLALLRRH